LGGINLGGIILLKIPLKIPLKLSQSAPWWRRRNHLEFFMQNKTQRGLFNNLKWRVLVSKIYIIQPNHDQIFGRMTFV
jgi:hypothetical protein